MEKITLNYELSKELYNKGEYTVNYCYDNVFQNSGVVGNRYPEMKVMFCYLSVGSIVGLYTRHACFYFNGEAVDPTILDSYEKSGKTLNRIEYIPFKIMSMDEYFQLIAKEKNTGLYRVLSRIEMDEIRKLNEQGLTVIG